MNGRGRARGFAIFFALMLVVIVSLGASVAVQGSRLQARREQEEELLFVGNELRQAIASYHALAVGGRVQYPRQLEDLLEDHRTPGMLRHLRRVYADPMTGNPDWVLERVQDRIVGVHSRSTLAPVRKAGFEAANASFSKALRYSEWRFLADPAMQLAANGGSPKGGDPQGVGPPTPGGSEPDSGTAKLLLIRACMDQFMFPAAECTANPPPLGTNTNTCQVAYRGLYDQCIAQINSAAAIP